ncbi:hypothetical protein JCM16303_006565 [Sporobolomyces ruberrimus]
MPSWISIGTTAVASLPDRIFALPLLILSGLFPPLFPVVKLLLVPFALVAKSIKYIGVLLQTLFLLQAVLFEAFGDGLNSFASSSSSPAAALTQARLQLTNLSTTIYPAALSAYYGTHFDPLTPSSPDDEYPLTQEAIDEWGRDGVILKRDLEEGIKEVVELWVTVLEDPRKDYLEAVREELDRIQAKRPTLYLYQDQNEIGGGGGGGTEDWARKIEQSDNEYQAEETARMDKKFEEFLDKMGMPEDARATLDHKADPKNPNSQTFRQVLRANWEDMYGNNGVLGNIENELSGLFGMGSRGGGEDGEAIDLGMGTPLEPGDDIAARFEPSTYQPGRIPIMTIHLLRDQVIAAIEQLETKRGLVKYLEKEDPTDTKLLPKIQRHVSDEYLGFFQRCVKIDLKAREWATRLLSFFSSFSTPSSATTTTDPSKRFLSPSILLSSPSPSVPPAAFGKFIKKLDWTLTRGVERFLSPHYFAQATFGTEKGRFALRKLEREVERLERIIKEEEGKGKLGGEL